jgi:hypothetical protein
MGGWVKLGNNNIKPRPAAYKKDADLNWNDATFKLTSAPDRVLSATENRKYAVEFQGTITDGFGTRPYPHWSYFDAAAAEKLIEWQRSTEIPRRIVERNGCFYDTATSKWMSRMYFIDHNRLTGEYIIIEFDIELQGFDTAFLQANTIKPTPPTLPLLPESIEDPSAATPIAPPKATSTPTAPTNPNARILADAYVRDGYVLCYTLGIIHLTC